MLKKGKYLVVGILLVTILMTIAVAASGTSKWENLGFSFKDIYNDDNKNKVIAKLDGEAISKQDFDGKKIFLTYSYDREPSSQEVMEKVVYDKVLLIEAKKLNLYPTRDETLAYMQQIKSVKETAENEGIEIDEESEKIWNETLNGLEMTEEEYWKSEDTIRGYQAALAIAKLRNKLAQDWGLSEKMFTPEGIAQFEENLNNMVNERKKELKLEYLEPSYTN